MTSPSPSETLSSVVGEEISHFSALADKWWNPKGPMAPLHAMNPIRTSWVKDHLPDALFQQSEPPRLLDIGCGAGLASERFAQLGFNTLGVDASAEAIAAATAHVKTVPLPVYAAPLHYQEGHAELLVEQHKRFDVVCALEIIEHVRDPAVFLQLLADLTEPGGFVAVSTLNRTIRSYLMAKLGAEYLLRLLPIGTHDWKKFISPVELDRMAKQAGLTLCHLNGMSFIPPRWHISRDTSVNYIALFKKA
ncbi:bifunctional 2-polyprenyl-6-hydroxyphenol methylase/3-demethylubiquinol 3-O-methyltransferase UbiG [Saccharibacter sp. 17.LH.SD]|uniref:bifunctional 2-polyprenyl-6-hydroxyphenol methylase/3-demethylubiquinol 3-O-methyltransferase UbiG n=1 Tax=Saccharibacter sp. 17.LH.SD TaxID=2689393 RepID=UPI00136F909D|nr:bifunctional 2-polyprenyl-6-hydroxyphenol methylase/3-demethylubiquinol 3-O-methyltransferase UbiG [Saccharibacter sp. 17.LH.SD]MXV44577.1 bifunctional 2-polyprenyl-6-hydroxyphenol methylase/3-demethylubiquinol 3-O-methyltransferase UbiG [Saccharibacter sp. 17.LH.SD]